MKLRKAANTDNLQAGTKEREAFSSLKKKKTQNPTFSFIYKNDNCGWNT